MYLGIVSRFFIQKTTAT